MARENYGRRVRRLVRRKPNDGVPPPNTQTRKLIKAMKKENKNFTPVEIKAALEHGGHRISLDVIIGVLGGK